MILNKDFQIGGKKYHLTLKTFRDCDWDDTKYVIVIRGYDEWATHISSWSNEYGFHVWVSGTQTYPVATMKEAKVLLLKHLTNS
jgi:hypothetical protein